MDAILRGNLKRMSIIKVIANKSLWFAYMLGLLILVLLLIGFVILFVLNPYWLSIDTCLDEGKVWDYKQNVCREDCLIWQGEFGCIKLTEKQIEIFKNCGSSNICPSSQTYKEICHNNQKAWNSALQECKYNFRPEECFKLKGNWDYPSNCKQ